MQCRPFSFLPGRDRLGAAAHTMETLMETDILYTLEPYVRAFLQQWMWMSLVIVACFVLGLTMMYDAVAVALLAIFGHTAVNLAGGAQISATGAIAVFALAPYFLGVLVRTLRS